jgi:flagellar P-ring protein precursor FlgI
LDRVTIALRNPDLTTARRIGIAVNAMLGRTAAKAIDPGTVSVAVPERYRDNLVDLMTDIEQLRVEPDQIARVVIDEVSGTIVMGEHVRISTVAIAQGNLTIRITETPQVSQPGAFAPDNASTVTVERTDIEIDTGDDRQLVVMSEGVSLQELVDGLNALGVGPRDIIAILQTIKASGALQADLQVM